MSAPLSSLTVTFLPECSSKYIKPFGIGTERVADEVQKFFPEARIIRMDADTTSARHSHEQFISAFRNGDADILIGTQMITKGLDFKNVTLVGIIAADMSLNLDDYRAAERTFDLSTQVIGRAGRGDKDGRAVIQTYNPENETVSMIRIISNPDLYDQQKVRIVAVCYFEPKSDMLFLSKDDCKIYNTINGIKLDCNSGILKDIPYFDGLMNSKLNGEYVLIEGTFFKNKDTIYSLFCGYLKDVTRITLK